MKKTLNIRRLLTAVLIAATGLFISLHFADLRMHRPEYRPAGVVKIASGQAKYPYQYRSLLPLAALKIHHLLSEHGSFKLKAKEYCFVFESLFTYALLISFWFYLVSLGADRLHCLLGEGLLLLALTVTYLVPRQYPIYYLYDIPSLFFFTTGLLLLRRKNWFFFYPVFIFATWNRETTLLLTVAFLFTHRHTLSRQTLTKHVTAQAAIWLAVKTTLLLAYATRIDAVFHNNFLLNLAYFVTPALYPTLLSAVGYLWLPVVLGWKYLGSWNRSLVLSAMPFFAAMLFVGNMVEIRIFGELIPVFAAASLEIFIKGGTGRIESG